MLQKGLVSLIIPVYNVEKYLQRCLDSVSCQTYGKLEIILVDDGATDSSGAMCDAYRQQHPDTRVIHQHNQGLAAARNSGMEIATGEYMIFLDSDDYVTSCYVENLVRAAEDNEADMAISMFRNVLESEQPEIRQPAGPKNARCLDARGCLTDMLYQRGLETSAWGKLFRTGQIGQLRFPVGKLYEDVMFTTPMIAHSGKICVIDNVDYFYLQRSSSIQYQSFSPKKMDNVWNAQEMIQFVTGLYPELESAAHVRYFCGLCNLYMQIPTDSFDRERELVWSEITKNRGYALRDGNARKKAKIAALLTFLGGGALRWVYAKTQQRGQTAASR